MVFLIVRVKINDIFGLPRQNCKDRHVFGRQKIVLGNLIYLTELGQNSTSFSVRRKNDVSFEFYVSNNL